MSAIEVLPRLVSISIKLIEMMWGMVARFYLMNEIWELTDKLSKSFVATTW
jgi:hypothetical protein